MRTHLTRRVLAGVTSLTIGGAFVAASALAALADSPSPLTPISATVSTNANGTVTVSVSGELEWKNGGKCSTNKGAGYAVVWGDPDAPGNALPGTTGVGTTVATFGQPVDNAVHATSCASGSITSAFGPLAHTYASSSKLPSQVCAVGYHFDGKSASGSHSMIAGGVGLNTDNSVQEPNSGLPSVACVDVVAHKPDVAIAKTATPNVNVGDTIIYVVTPSNAGDFATDQTVTITDPLPAAVQFLSVTPGAGWSCSGGQSLTCTLSGSLPAHSTGNPITITAKALEAAKPSVTNVATISTPDDSNANNNVAQATTLVGAAPQLDVTIKKTATHQVIVGDPITYTLTVSNDATKATDKTLTVTDQLPTGVLFKSVNAGNGWNCNSGQNLTCTFAGSLAAGASAPVITVTATALASAVPSVTNVADVTNPDDTNPNNNEDKATTVVDTTAPVLSLIKSSDPASGSTVERGQQIDYTLSYSNTGDGDAGLTIIEDDIPTYTTYVAGSAACGTGCSASYDPNDNDIDWSLNLPAHTTGSVTFSVRVNDSAPDGAVIDNVATINNDGHKIPSNHVHHLVFVPSGDLRLHKSVDLTSAKVGDTLTYTLVARATGTMNQHNVVVTDEVPDGTTFKSVDCDNPCTSSESAGLVTWNLGEVDAGDSRSMTFKVTINGPAADGTLPTEIPNSGLVKSNETPKTPSNRVVTDITTVLGTKIVKTTPPATTLPFTGLPVLQDILLAMVLIGGGILLLTWPRLYGNRAQAV